MFFYAFPWICVREGFQQIPSKYPLNPPKSFPYEFLSVLTPDIGQLPEIDEENLARRNVIGSDKNISTPTVQGGKSLPALPRFLTCVYRCLLGC